MSFTGTQLRAASCVGRTLSENSCTGNIWSHSLAGVGQLSAPSWASCSTYYSVTVKVTEHEKSSLKVPRKKIKEPAIPQFSKVAFTMKNINSGDSRDVFGHLWEERKYYAKQINSNSFPLHSCYVTFSKYLNVNQFGFHTEENNISEKRWWMEEHIVKGSTHIMCLMGVISLFPLYFQVLDLGFQFWRSWNNNNTLCKTQ